MRQTLTDDFWGFRVYELRVSFKGAFSGLIQFLATDSLLKMMKNVFYFTLKARFVLKIFKCLAWLFALVEKRLD